MPKYEGVIFPLPIDMIKRAAKKEKDVFIKYTNLHLTSKMTLYLYGSGGNKKIIAESEIKNVKSLLAKNVWEKYGDRLIQNKSEFEEYIGEREGKELVVLELDEIQRYNNSIDVPEGKKITMAGLYVNEKMKNKMDV